MSRRISDLTAVSATGAEYFNYVLGATDQVISLDNLSNYIVSDLLYVRRTLTASEIASLYTVPVEIIPAPGANYVIAPQAIFTSADGTGTSWSAAGLLRFKYNGGNGYTKFVPGTGNVEFCYNVQVQTPTELLENAAFMAYLDVLQITGGTSLTTVHVWYHLINI